MGSNDIFFPFLPGSHGPTERYYEALQAAAIGTSYYSSKKQTPVPPPPPPSNNRNYNNNNNKAMEATAEEDQPINSANGGEGNGVNIQPGVVPQPPIVAYRHSEYSTDRIMSPPVPALLKKLKIANGEALRDNSEAKDGSQWEGFKISKELENMQIKDSHHQPQSVSEQDKKDLLFRLSLLKQVINK